MSRVLFAGGGTGGHLYPALSIGRALQEERPGLELHFVGARRGVEARVLPAEGVPHTLLPLEPIRRDRPWRNVTLPLALARSLAGLEALGRRFPPDLFVGTGGYASGPAGAWALAHRIPVALQEQNSYPGVTTRLLARRARRVFLGFPEARDHLKPGARTRIVDSGNPVRPPRPARGEDARALHDLEPGGVLLLVVGGSQGARALNEVLLGALQGANGSRSHGAFPRDLRVLWATGPAHFESMRDRLEPLGLQGRVAATGYLQDMPAALAVTDIALSRAGAIMTAELLAWGIPSILVPLPTAAADHQTGNALALQAAGAAEVLAQASLTPAVLWAAITDLALDGERRIAMAAAARRRGRPDAAREIARELLTLVEGS